ncbi:MAG: P-II family nitrogen regulator [Leptospiraceae bacterium]|nr:P-II family nitrogen regulator [Leptospiraceae bacterium]MCK6382104.1 P-II family nitrogen regulator [Leptospiraceae bacterium]NUM41834.1 P-II family nitrogen regulator [Leptospiraceae bacterium]
MKLIIAIIQPNKLEEVKAELTKNEIFRLTVSEVRGYGQQKGRTAVFRGHEYDINLLPKVRLEIAVNDAFVKPTVDAILKSAKTGEGKIGDGKIFILPIEEVIRIRTGEKGSTAI